MISVLGMDPGKVTGWAEITVSDHRVVAHNGGEHDHDDFIDQWNSRLAMFDVVVCEDFTVGPHTLRTSRGRMWSLETIGWATAVCRQRGLPFALQQPSAVKPLVTDEVLRRFGCHERTAGGHQNDAARHALYWLAKSGHLCL